MNIIVLCAYDFPWCVSVATLQDVMNKVRSDTILDMNLEKSRVKELVSEQIQSWIKLEFGVDFTLNWMTDDYFCHAMFLNSTIYDMTYL